MAALGDVLGLVASLIPSKYYTANDIAPPVTTWITITVYSIALFFHLAAVWGAINFHRLAVSIVLVWQVIFLGLVIAACAVFPWNTTAESVGGQIAGFTIQIAVQLLIQLLIIYSMGSFVSEVSKGIMSKETHAREKCKCTWLFF